MRTTLSETEFVRRFVARYGEKIGNDNLVAELGFASREAVSEAIRNGSLLINTFRVPGEQGIFARSEDVARFVFHCRAKGNGE